MNMLSDLTLIQNVLFMIKTKVKMQSRDQNQDFDSVEPNQKPKSPAQTYKFAVIIFPMH